MKPFTDIEQSKKLSEILAIESADAWWAERYEGKVTNDGQYIVNEEPFYYISFIKSSEINYSQDTVKDIPCWSLSALLNVMQEPELIKNSDGTWLIRVWYNRYPFSRGGYNNPVDACFKMILKLHEQKLL